MLFMYTLGNFNTSPDSLSFRAFYIDIKYYVNLEMGTHHFNPIVYLESIANNKFTLILSKNTRFILISPNTLI